MSRTARAHSLRVLAFATVKQPPGGHAMGILSIIGMIIVGFIVGVLARFFYPGAVNMGFWMTVLLGIGGSLVGGVITSLLWKTPTAASTAPAGSCRSWARWSSSGSISTSGR